MSTLVSHRGACRQSEGHREMVHKDWLVVVEDLSLVVSFDSLEMGLLDSWEGRCILGGAL